MLDEHLTPRHAALIGFNLFDHILDASAVPIGPRVTQVLPVELVLLSFDGKLGRVEGSLEHPLPFKPHRLLVGGERIEAGPESLMKMKAC